MYFWISEHPSQLQLDKKYFFKKKNVAKNQNVLILYSNNIYKMDELTQKVRNLKNIKSADLFIPKKISFYDNWIKKTIIDFKKSSKLHLTYQTN